MLIGIDASRANYEKKTGTEWYSYNIIEELKKIDSQNRYFLYSKESLKGPLGILPPNFENKVLLWPPKRLWNLARLALEVNLRPPDILFIPAHTIPLISSSFLVTTIHDIGFERFPELYGNLELKYHRFSLRLALKKADKIITPSQFTKKEILNHFQVNPDKIAVIYNGFRENLFKPISDKDLAPILEKYHLKKPYLLFVGRLEEKKNAAGLVKAFGLLKQKRRDLSDLNLVLAGEPGYKFSEVEKNINQFNLYSQVRKLNYVPASDLPYLYNGAEIFVFVSLYEGFGIPLLEAMACGTPVVASNLAAIPEITGEAAYLINPKSLNEISEALEKVLKDKILRTKMREKGLKQVKNFSFKKAASELLSLFKSFL